MGRALSFGSSLWRRRMQVLDEMMRERAFKQLFGILDKITDRGLSDRMLNNLTEKVMRMLEGAYTEGRLDEQEERGKMEWPTTH
jgi:hypothetical protein